MLQIICYIVLYKFRHVLILLYIFLLIRLLLLSLSHWFVHLKLGIWKIRVFKYPLPYFIKSALLVLLPDKRMPTIIKRQLPLQLPIKFPQLLTLNLQLPNNIPQIIIHKINLPLLLPTCPNNLPSLLNNILSPLLNPP